MRVTSSLLVCLALTACSGGSKGVGTNTNGGNVAPAIAAVELSPEPAFESTLLNCTPTGVTDSDGDNVTTKFAWKVNNADIGVDTPTLDGGNFDKGDVVNCTVTPNDGSTDGVPVTSNDVEIQNSPPRADSVDVAPSPATPRDTLTANPNGWSDADPSDGEDWRYAWFVNGASAGTGSTQLQGGFAKGDQVYVVATPFDGTDLGQPVQSDIVNIINTPPELASATLTPSSPIASDVLSCTPGAATDLDSDPVTFGYQWFVNGASAGSGTDILSAPAFGAGDQVYCVITPNDGEDDGTPVQSNTVTVQNSAPTMASVTLAPDPATELDTLNCTPNGLVDPDGDSITVQFSWTVGGLGAGVTTSSLNGTYFDKGDAVQCFVVASDGSASSAPAGSNVVIIDNTPPSMTSGVITPATIYTNTNAGVTAYGWNDVDGDVPQYTYQWYKNGLPVPGATSATLLSPNFVKNEVLSVQITPFDGEDSGAPVTTPTITVQNSPPTAPTVQITPAMPDNADTLLCGLSGFSTDADLDAVSYSYAWLRNGASTIYTTNSVPAAATFLGDQWTCIVTPFDGTDTGPTGSHNVTVTDGTAPDAPLLDNLNDYQNPTGVTVSGDAEPGSTVEVTAYCDGATNGQTRLTSAAPDGSFSVNFTLQPGEHCDFEATATDAGNNTSAPSVPDGVTVCAVPDPWEGGGYGDTSLDAVDEWGAIADDGLGNIVLQGNLLDQDPDDWFLIHSSDNVAADRIAQNNFYDFTAALTAGAPEYTFIVYKGSVSVPNRECSTLISGYDGYNDYWLDRGDAPNHPQASPTTRCGPIGTAIYNECESMATDYYIRVVRTTTGPKDCLNYEITITNNAP